MHVELARLHLQQFLSHISFDECFTEKKNRRHFHHHTAYYYSRGNKSRWYAIAIRIDYVGRLYRPPIVECRRPKCLATWKWWVQFGLSRTVTFVSRRPGFVNILWKKKKKKKKKRLTYRNIPTALAPFSVVIRRMMMQNVVCFSFKWNILQMICEIKNAAMQSRELHVHFSFLSTSRLARGILLTIWIIIMAIEGYNTCVSCITFRKNTLHIVEDLGKAGLNKMVSNYFDQIPRVWNL